MYYPAYAFVRRSDDSRETEEEDPTEFEEDDPRSPFARDRDRLIYSSAFRQLAGKSQVVASTEIGPFHTRLTHSLKVAQLGRRLAEQIRAEARNARISTESDGSSTVQVEAPDPDLVEFACLAHDIGHPPFGHNGERALHKAVDRLVGQAVQNFLKSSGQDPEPGVVTEAQRYIGGFEGNPQTFRIVTRLSHKAFPSDLKDVGNSFKNDYVGLDLTVAAISAVSKYPWERTDLNVKKWGAYGAADDEQSDYCRLDEACRSLGWNPPIFGEGAKRSFECQLMDWCDDVTYAVHDVEDFYMIGMIPLERIFDYRQIFKSMDDSLQDECQEEPEPVEEDIEGRYPETAEWRVFREHLQKKWKDELDYWNEERQIDSKYLNSLRDDLIDKAYGPMGWDASPGSIKARRLSHRRSSDLIQYFAGINVRCDGKPFLYEGTLALAEGEKDDRKEIEKRLRYQCDMLKELIWRYVINMPNMKTQQAGQRRIIDDLVEIYANDNDLLPRHYKELADDGAGYSQIPNNADSKKIIPRLAQIRVAADYVSSLTEPQALALHKRLTGVELGGFRDFV